MGAAGLASRPLNMGMGDDLMLAGEARELRRADPRKVAARHGKHGIRCSPVFDHNPHMASAADLAAAKSAPDRLQWLDENAGRRYRASETKERRIWTSIGPTRGELYFSPAELDAARAANALGRIVIEPNLKLAATRNKDWGFERWQTLVNEAPALPWLQLGAPGARRLAGVRFVETPTFRVAAAILRHAAAAVLPEGGLHHAAAALGVPAVVIFGGYISPVQTGYPEHVNVFTGGEPCGNRLPCVHCRSAMAAIVPGRVLVDLDRLMQRRAAS